MSIMSIMSFMSNIMSTMSIMYIMSYMAIMSIYILQVEHRNSDGVLATAKASDHAWYLDTIPQVIHFTGVFFP